MKKEPRAQRSSTSVAKERLIAVALFLIPAFIVIGGFLLGPQALQQYDARNPMTVECTVTSAEDQLATTTSRTGLGGSSAQVLIRTSSCGDLLLTDGVTKQNGEDIAERFSNSSTYSFEVGSGSQKLRWLLDLIGVTPKIFAYEPA